MSFIESDSHIGDFVDRRDAGRQLADHLLSLADEHPVVVALPRGGVPVAREVAMALGAPLEILAVRKLGAPHNPEYGIGALVEDGTRLIDAEAVAVLGITGGVLDSIIARETAELRRRVDAYRDDCRPLELKDRTIIVVDDGVATGVTDTAALRALRHREPRRLILAVPVCAADTFRRLRGEADGIVCLLVPPLLHGVGKYYQDFSQVSDEDVVSVLGEFHIAAA
ncbi:MAG TPA: phosphoribosyltransferase family protein [Solirubrobacterales bacterium]|nr:phosphoribosyltransferase family protein [Solirubrobacterales bacterium]